VKKQKELRYLKALPKSGVEPSTPFRFDVLAQLANIPTRISLYELLRLSKSTRDALKEALANAEIFVTQFLLYVKRKTTTIATIPQSSFHASPSPQKTCKLKKNMIDLCITHSTLDHLK